MELTGNTQSCSPTTHENVSGGNSRKIRTTNVGSMVRGNACRGNGQVVEARRVVSRGPEERNGRDTKN